MGKHGYTLIEVIVSIMILSIASMTLAGAFTKVIHFMSRSNDVKNASNLMYAYAEGNDETESSVIKTIKSSKSYYVNGIEVEGDFIELSSTYSDDVILKQYKILSPLFKFKSYQTFMNSFVNGDNSLYNSIQKINIKHSDQEDYNNIIGDMFDFEGLEKIKFDSVFLPEGMKYLGDLNVRVAYPWQKKGKYNNIESNGAPLIFITDSTDSEIKDYTLVFAVYLNNNWYCYNNGGITPYTLENRSMNNALRLYKNNSKDHLSYTEFENEVLRTKGLDNKSIWKLLDSTQPFSDVNSKRVWVDISD